MTDKKKPIEVAVPLEAVNIAGARERAAQTGRALQADLIWRNKHGRPPGPFGAHNGRRASLRALVRGRAGHDAGDLQRRAQAFRFGNQKINLHVKGHEFEPKAHVNDFRALLIL